MKTKSLKIFFDIDAAAQPNKSGIGYYSLGLLQSISEEEDITVYAHYFNFFGLSNPNLPKLKNVIYKESRFIHRKVYNFFRRFGIQIPYEILSKVKSDFAIFPNFTHRPSIFNTPFALAVHDLTYINYASTVSPRNQKDLSKFVPKSIAKAKFIICISETIKKELTEYYQVLPHKVIVTLIPPPAYKPNVNFSISQALKEMNIQKKFILFIGNSEPRKNIYNLVKGYNLLDKKLRDTYLLVISGAKGWGSGQEHNFNINNEIINTGYVTEEEKYALFSSTTLLVMPSLYEGYGMPIIEAMQHNKPVAVSDIEVFHEVTNDAAFFFDQTNPISIAQSLTESLTNKQKRASFLDQNSKLLKELTWSNTAKIVTNRIKETLGIN
ncbi:MAG: putative glycosyl transferase group 1 [Candidatus Saccharibacteria bacterium]|nr:putative glycosyl transferase group 1 [Candidatus Saccharibacteria bacterium]